MIRIFFYENRLQIVDIFEEEETIAPTHNKT